MSILAADADAQALFPPFMGNSMILQEDPGAVTAQQVQICAATMVAETDEDMTSGTGVQTGVAGRVTGAGGGKVKRTYLLALVIYVSDRTRTPEAKTKIVRLTGQMKNVLLKYRRDPDSTRQLAGNSLWYHTVFMPGRTTTYRKTEAHQQSITLLNIYSEERVY